MPWLKRGVGIDELCDSRLTPLACSNIFPVVPDPNPQEDAPKFREFSKRAEDGPSQASTLPKTFPVIPIIIPCTMRQSRIAAGHLSGTLNIQRLAGNVGLLAVSRSYNSLASAKEFTLFCKSWIWVRSWLTVVGFLSCCIDSSSILNCLALSVSSQQILRNSWQFLARLSWKSLVSHVEFST